MNQSTTAEVAPVEGALSAQDLLHAVAPGDVIEIERCYGVYHHQQFRLPPGRTRDQIQDVSCRYDDLTVYWTDGTCVSIEDGFEQAEIDPSEIDFKNPGLELVPADRMHKQHKDDITDIPMMG